MSSLWTVLALWAAGLGAAAQFGKISVVYDLAQRIYPQAGAMQLGLLVSVVGFPGLIFGTTAGIILEGLGYRRTVIAGLIAGAALSILQMALLPMPVMLALRVLEGLSHLAIVVAAPVLIAASAPPARLGLAMSLWSTFFALTYTILALAGRPLALALGVPALFGAHAIWMVLIAALLMNLLPQEEPPRLPKLRFQALIQQHLAIYGSPRIAAPACGFVCYTSIYVALLTVLPPMAGASLQPVLALWMPLASIAVSLSLGVWLLGRVEPVRVVMLGFALALPGALGLGLAPDLPLVQLAAPLGIAGALGLVQGASFAAIAALNPAGPARAQAAGAVAQLGNIGTTAGTPLLAALIAAQGAGAIPVFVAGLALLGIGLHLWQAQRRARSPGAAARQ